MTYLINKLNFNLEDFEPYMDKETILIHYNKHHKNYLNNTNLIINEINPNIFNIPPEQLFIKLNNIKEKKELIIKLKNNLGGHINHEIFWKGLKINSYIDKNFKKIIEKEFFSLENFKYLFEKECLNKFGSCWVWLIKTKNNKLKITSTSNQDNPTLKKKYSDNPNYINGYPLMGLDLWEHAYYLKYKNEKIKFIKSYWNLINWEEIIKRYEKIK